MAVPVLTWVTVTTAHVLLASLVSESLFDLPSVAFGIYHNAMEYFSVPSVLVTYLSVVHFRSFV
jgi:hypothetical protein